MLMYSNYQTLLLILLYLKTLYRYEDSNVFNYNFDTSSQSVT